MGDASAGNLQQTHLVLYEQTQTIILTPKKTSESGRRSAEVQNRDGGWSSLELVLLVQLVQ